MAVIVFTFTHTDPITTKGVIRFPVVVRFTLYNFIQYSGYSVFLYQ